MTDLSMEKVDWLSHYLDYSATLYLYSHLLLQIHLRHYELVLRIHLFSIEYF